MTSPSARRSAARRARPVTPSGTVSRRGGITVMRIFGNQALADRVNRENGVCSTPSIRTGIERRLGALGDHGRPFVHLHQAAGGGDAAFGEDDARRAAFNRADHRAQRERDWSGRSASRRPATETASPTIASRRTYRSQRPASRAERRPAAGRRGTTHGWRRSRRGLRRAGVLEAMHLDSIEHAQHEPNRHLQHRLAENPGRDHDDRQRRGCRTSRTARPSSGRGRAPTRQTPPTRS